MELEQSTLVSEIILTFQPPKEGRSIQRQKRCDKHGDKDENNSLNNVYFLDFLTKILRCYFL